VPGGHVAGLGANWGQPNEVTFSPDLRDQYSFELFLRIQLANQVAITPDVQLLVNPALNPDVSSLWVFGVRGRMAL
jgi:porin